jgi:Vacuolar protein sorting-associated protein 62
MTLDEIKQLVRQHAPIVRLYDTGAGINYVPSSVEFYLSQVDYVQVDGGSSRVFNPPATSHLRAGDAGKNDFLRIPGVPGTPGYEKIAKGDLANARAYVHFIDLTSFIGPGWYDAEYFFFYPYNGPGSARVEFTGFGHDTAATARFKIFGEHEGDWEHVTLRFRVDPRVRPYVVAIYFSQHSGGEWVNPDEIRYNAQGRPYVYSSRDGHASYVDPGIYPTEGGPHIDKSFGIGPVSVGFSGFLANSCNNNTIEWDTQDAHEIVAISNVPGISFQEPAWLQFLGRWGAVWSEAERQQRATEALADIVDRVVSIVPGFAGQVAKLIGDYVADQVKNKLPLDEIVPDGPTGPKDKAAWQHEEGGPTDGWTMKVVDPNQDIRVVLDEMNKWVQAHDSVPALVATAKLAASNQRRGDARGIIFYYLGKLPLQPVAGKNWFAQTYTTDNDYQYLYDSGLKFLGGQQPSDNGTTLTLEQSIVALVSMSNAQHNPATLTVWWPADVTPMEP